MAVHERAYARLLKVLPGEDDDIEAWVSDHSAVDQVIGKMCASGELHGVILQPHVASQPALLHYDDADKALAERFVI